jgi:hypothetical protein
LWDFVFQLNSDFISNLNLNHSGLLCPYISLGAPPPRLPTSILPQNQTLAATQVPPSHGCLLPPPPLFQCPPFKLNPVPVMRSQWPNHRRKNHVESRSVASTIYRWSHTVATFSANLKSIRRHWWVLLAVLSLSDFTDLKLEVCSLSFSKFWRTSSEVQASKLHCCLLHSAPSKFYKYAPVRFLFNYILVLST